MVLVRIWSTLRSGLCIEKWSVFGPILVNLGPIWQMAALLRCFKEVSRVLKESVKCVSRKFHKSFKVVSSFFLQFCCSMNLIAVFRILEYPNNIILGMLVAGDQEQCCDWPGEEGEANSGEEACWDGGGAEGKQKRNYLGLIFQIV